MAASLISGEQGRTFTNWATTFSCKPELYFEPTSITEISQILKEARRLSKKVKVCGFGHSPSDIACTNGFMIDLCRFKQVTEVDKENCTVTVQGGCLLRDIINYLEPHGMALQNMGSLAEFTIAGVICTGSHGTGINHGILSTQVLEITFLTANCEEITCSRTNNSDIFRATCCGLGALGIITSVKIQCEPAFNLHQRRSSCTLDEVLENLDKHIARSQHFRFEWVPHTEAVVLWHVDRTDKPVQEVKSSWFWDNFVGHHCLEFAYWISSFIPQSVPFINRTFFNLLYSQPQEAVNVSDKIFTFDCRFQQYVTDWAIPIEHTGTVLRELKSWLDSNPDAGAHIFTEVRFCKGDDFMLSAATGYDTCFINIIKYRPYGKKIPYAKYWTAYEDIVKRVGGRPHWAKAHKLTAKDFASMYPEFDKFCEIRMMLDPQGMFLNDYLERVLFVK